MSDSKSAQSTIDWQHLYDVMAKRFEALESDMKVLSDKIQRSVDENVYSARKDLILQILSIGDDIHRCGTCTTKEQNLVALQQGIALIQRKFDALLARVKVCEVPAQLGAAFDPHIHEADHMAPSNTYPEDTVVEVSERGYKLGETLLRPARVCVSSGKSAE